LLAALDGAAAAWPLAARAQQAAMPVVGFLEIRSPETITERLRAFRQGLKETGYVEGENIAIDYRWAEQMERLPELAAQLVRRREFQVTGRCLGRHNDPARQAIADRSRRPC
jgi:putative tryptophan/tyrosine transport system substrate-binding protein